MSVATGISEYPHVAVVIPTWNHVEETLGCLEVLSRSDWPTMTTIVVDNGSEEEVEARVGPRFPNALVIRNPSNLGFAGGMNVGMRCALELDADYILLLNNDTLVDEAMVRALVNAARARPDAGIINPLEFFRNQPDVISSAGLRCNPRHAYQGGHLGIHQRDRGQFSGIREVEASPGTAMFVPAEVVREVGMLDEQLFLITEDVDWSLRMRSSGKRVYVTSDARIWHGVATTFGGNDSPLMTYYHARNSFVVTARHAPMRGLRALLRHLEILFANLIHAARCRRPLANARAVLAGWRDYRRGRLGPHPDSLRPQAD